MQLIEVTKSIGFNNSIYGEGFLESGKTYYTFSQFAKETIDQGYAHDAEHNNLNVVFFQPSHLNSTNRPKNVLLMFSGCLGDALTVGLVLSLVTRKYGFTIDMCCAKNKWDDIFVPMGLSGKHVCYPPDIETLVRYDAVWTDVTDFYYSKNEGLKASPVVQLLRGFGVEEEKMQCIYRVPTFIEEKCRLPATKSIRIGVNLDSNGPVKSYPARRHKYLVQALITAGYEIYLLGTKKHDQGHLDLNSTLDLRGKTSIQELAAILEQMDVVLGVDSFIVHLANLLSIPAVALLSTTAASSFGWHEHVSCIVSQLECAPCFAVFDHCPRGYSECHAFYHKSIDPELIVGHLQKRFSRDYLSEVSDA